MANNIYADGSGYLMVMRFGYKRVRKYSANFEYLSALRDKLFELRDNGGSYEEALDLLGRKPHKYIYNRGGLGGVMHVSFGGRFISRYSTDYGYLSALKDSLLELRDNGGSYEDAVALLANNPKPPKTHKPSKPSKPPKTPKPPKPPFFPYIYINKDELRFYLVSKEIKRGESRGALVYWGGVKGFYINKGFNVNSRWLDKCIKVHMDEFILFSQATDRLRVEFRDGEWWQVDNYILENKRYRLAD